MTVASSALNDDRVWARFYRDKKSVEEIAAELGVSEHDISPVSDVLVKALSEITRFTFGELGKKNVMIGELHAHVRGLVATIEGQNKLMANLTEALDDLTGRKRAELEAAKAATAKDVSFKRNKSWLQSVKLGLAHGLWWAPTELVAELKMPVVGVVMGVLMLFGRLAGWLLDRPALVIGGLCGYVSPPPKPPG